MFSDYVFKRFWLFFSLIRSKINGAKKSCISIASVPSANQFSRWQPISWPGNCTLPPVLQHRWDYNFSFGVLLTLTNFLKAILSKFISKSGQILKKNAGKIDQFSWPVNCTLPTVLHQRWKKIFLGGGLDLNAKFGLPSLSGARNDTAIFVSSATKLTQNKLSKHFNVFD